MMIKKYNPIHHLDMMADIHRCSSVLILAVSCCVMITGKKELPVEMKQHPKHGNQLLLIVLVLLFEELQQDILQVHEVD